MSRKRQFDLLCGIVALFCIFSMYIPIIVPCDAREYWTVARFAFQDGTLLLSILLSLSEALLLWWAVSAFRGTTDKVGLIASVANVVVLVIIIASMSLGMRTARPYIIAVMAVDAVFAVVMAVLQVR